MKISAKRRNAETFFVPIKITTKHLNIIRQIMRVSLFVFVLILSSLQVLLAVSVKGQDMATQKVSVKLNNENLESAFVQIEKQSGFIFYYRKEDVKFLNHLSLPANFRAIDETLSLLLQNTVLNYKQVDGHILIQRDEQTAYQIQGRILSADQKPIPFATVFIQKKDDETVKIGAQADSTGFYKLNVKDKGDYTVRFSYIGKETSLINVKVGDEKIITLNVTLFDKTNELKEVEVVATAPTINYTPGNTEVSIPNNKYFRGLNTLTILKRLPGVTYDQSSGAIQLDGKSVVIYMNDKPVKLTNQALLSYLQTLPAGSLDKIDLTSQPNAKYDADITGGVINIHTRQMEKNTWNTVVSYNYDQYRYLEQNLGLITAISLNRLTLTANLNYLNGKGYNKTTSTNAFNNTSTGNTNLNEINNRVYSYNPFTYNFSALLYLDKKRKQSIEALYTGNSSNTKTNSIFNSTLYSNNVLASQTFTNSFKNENSPTTDIGLEYVFKIDSTGKNLRILANHSLLKYSFPANYTTSFQQPVRPDSIVTQNYFNKSNINSIKADYVIPKSFLNTKIETGVKASWADVNNSNDYEITQNGITAIDESRTNGFNFHENIYAAYLLFSNTLSKKLSIQYGGRLEDTKSKGIETGPTLPVSQTILDTNYVRFYPSGSLLYKINPDNHLSFTINSKITRPQYQQYNPFMFYVDPYNVNEGNPYLLPAISTNMELMYAFKDLFSIKLYYSDQSKQIVSGLYASDTSALAINKPVNLEYARYLGMTVSFQKNLTKSWYLSASGQLGTAYKKGYINGELFDPVNPLEFWASVNQSWNLGKTWTLDNSIFYRNKNFQGIYINNSIKYVNMDIKKSLLKDKLYIRAELDDIFNTSGHFQGTYSTNQLINTIDNRYPGRQFVLNLTYSFKNKNINTYHENSSSEEIQRAKQ